MPWALAEREAKQQRKLSLVLVGGTIGVIAPLTAWLAWGVRAAMRDGERTIASAHESLRLTVGLGLALFAFAVWNLRSAAPPPPAGRRPHVAFAFAALVGAASPTAALPALPGSG